MTIDMILDYVRQTPWNVNPTVLRSMLEQLVQENSKQESKTNTN